MMKGSYKIINNVIFVLIFCLSLPIEAFAENWNTTAKNVEHNAVISSATNPNLELRWTKSTTNTSTFTTPIYQNGIFYFSERITSNSWTVYAINKNSGSELWRTSGSGYLSPGISISEDYVVVPSTNLICLSAKDGHKVWEITNPISGFNFSKPLIFNNIVYVWNTYGGSGYVSAYNISNGNKSWPNDLSFGIEGAYPFSISNNNLIILYSTRNNYSNIYSYSLSENKNWGPLIIPRNPSGPIVVDGNTGFLSTISGTVSKIDLSTGIEQSRYNGFPNASIVVARNGHAYFTATSQYETSIGGDSFIYDLPYTSADPPFRRATMDDFFVSVNNNVILFGEKLYFANEKGQIFAYNTTSGATERFSIAPGVNLGQIMVADDVLVAMDYSAKNLYFSTDINYSFGSETRIEIENPYECTDCNQYLGQLHSHYIPDIAGINSSPFEVEKKYRDAGYDFIALTEHNKLEPDPGVDGILHIQNSEENTQGRGGNHLLGIGINNSIDINLSDQDRVNGYFIQNGFIIASHPNLRRYKWTVDKLLRLENYNSVEIFNTGVNVAGRYLDGLPMMENWNMYDKAFSTDKWDELLSRGKKVWGTANDDYTPGNPGFNGGAVMVLSSSNTQENIMDALKNGHFYTLQGSEAPKIQINVENNSVHLTSDQQGEIKFIGQDGEVLRKDRYSSDSTYQIVGNEKYIRAEVMGSSGKKSWTEPIFVNRIETAKSDWAGKQKAVLASASLISSSSGNLAISTLPVRNYPSALPPLGLYSPIYSLQTSGILSTEANLEIDYSSESLPFSEESLSVYVFNETTGTWDKITSVVDELNNKVTAKLSHFSYYALSSEIVDTTGPKITFADNQYFNKNSTGVTTLRIGVTDNSEITSLSGYLDEKFLLFEDTNAKDGFNNSINLSKVATGKHYLTLLATDYFGNVTESKFTVNIFINTKILTNKIDIIMNLDPR